MKRVTPINGLGRVDILKLLIQQTQSSGNLLNVAQTVSLQTKITI